MAAEETPTTDDKDVIRDRRKNLLRIGLAACLLLAFALRVYGVNFGLPHTYYWDEPTVVNRAVRFGSGDLNPHFFYYPAFYMYVLFLASGLYFVLGRLTGHFHSVQDFAVEYFVDPTGVYLTARITTALFGTAAVLAAYLIGKKYFGTLTGYIGAIFLAVSVLHATHSHIAITDVPHGFFILAACGPLYHILHDARRRDYVLAGFLIGLGAATKYLAILLIPSLLLAHLWSKEAEARFSSLRGRLTVGWLSPNLLLAFGAIFVGFFVGSPFNVLDFRAFLADYRQQLSLSTGEGARSSLGFYLVGVLPGDFGWPLLLTAAVGLVWMACQRQRAYYLFLSFPLVYFLVVMRFQKGFARYMIPEDPFLALMAAYALTGVFQRLSSNNQKSKIENRKFDLALVPAVAALCAPPLYANLRWDGLMAHETDPRTAALDWAHRNIPAGSVVAVQSLFDRTFYNAPLLTDRRLEKIDRDIPRGGRFRAVRRRVSTALNRRPVYREAKFVQDYDALQNAGVVCVFVSSLNGRLKPAFREQLDSRAAAYRFAPDPDALLGIPQGSASAVSVQMPEITVYVLRQEPLSARSESRPEGSSRVEDRSRGADPSR